jgi:hypothetical protein
VLHYIGIAPKPLAAAAIRVRVRESDKRHVQTALIGRSHGLLLLYTPKQIMARTLVSSPQGFIPGLKNFASPLIQE